MSVILVAAALALGAQSVFASEGRYGETSPKLASQRAGEGGPTNIPEMWSAWCARCHAEDGSGRVNEPTVTVEPMDFTDCKVASGEPDADWERAVAKGGPGVGLSSQMPAFEDSITPAQISAFVSHMRGFCNDAGWPSGNNNFPRPILTEKAFPENEVVLLPVISHFSEAAAPSITEARFKAVYERRVGKRSMVEVGVPMVSTNSLLDRTAGVGDLEVAFKHAIFASAAAPRIVSLGLEMAFPTGNRFEDHGRGTTLFEPYISAGAMVRAWYLQTQLKVELPTDRQRASRALVYSGYFGRDTGAAPDTWTIGVELNGEVTFPLIGVASRVVALTPQVRKGLTGTGALAASFGVMLPVNQREAQGVRWVGYLLWEYLEPLRARQ